MEIRVSIYFHFNVILKWEDRATNLLLNYSSLIKMFFFTYNSAERKNKGQGKTFKILKY